ncbi:hypothetical protein FB451DRAFT_1183033 [Mycena latifolia]|nr:hypothetical protein FB451DRAFT_1183033 [Mycena latifolia]
MCTCNSVEIWGNYCANGIEAYEGLQSCKKIGDFLGMPNYPISSSMRGHYSTAGQNDAERKGMQNILEILRGKSTAISPVADNMADNNPAQPAVNLTLRSHSYLNAMTEGATVQGPN